MPHLSQSLYQHEITEKSFLNTSTLVKVGNHFLIQWYYSNIEQVFFCAMASNKELLPERRLTHFLKQDKNNFTSSVFLFAKKIFYVNKLTEKNV